MKAKIDTLEKFMVPLNVLKMTTLEYQHSIANKRYIAHLL